MVRDRIGASAWHTEETLPPFPFIICSISGGPLNTFVLYNFPFHVLNLKLVSHDTGASLRTSAHSYTRLKSAHWYMGVLFTFAH